MPMLNDRYIKLQHEDYLIIAKIFNEIISMGDTLTPEEHIVYGKIQKIIQLMKEKWEKKDG